MTTCYDQAERKACLDVTQSWIVQAPAGSGKTELLTQRFLRLLATVTQPETIIAITFTKKAASEMKERIIHALLCALNTEEPSAAHAATTWNLAKRALERAIKYNWDLLANPNRLRIMTLDALSLMLSTHLPITSGFGALPTIAENAIQHYEQAVDTFLSKTHHDSLNESVDALLLQFDNQAELLKNLLVQLISKREQWLHHVITYHSDPDALKNGLENALQKIVNDHLNTSYHCIRESICAVWEDLLIYSAQSTQTNMLEIKLSPDMQSLPTWQAIANLLLTKQNTARKNLTIKQGFPSKTGAKEPEKSLRIAYKEKAVSALSMLADNPAWIEALTMIKHLPPIHFNPKNWSSLYHLITILPWVMAELVCLFQKTGEVDFNELTLGALRAMGNEDQPTDLAMKLDYQINHLLIDEFQDTSLLQGKLLKQLTAHWQVGDSKTLFIVGDPMQSIYRFRNADVSLFLQAQTSGLGNIHLNPIHLTSNFRSDTTIIEWINRHFHSIFPPEAEMRNGSVPYSKSQATQTIEDRNTGVFILDGSPDALCESINIKNTIETLQDKHPDDSIAVLVRTRSQLTDLIQTLRGAHIPIEATEIDYLAHRSEIIDCLILTRALRHMADRVAWFALLMTPLFGFSLADCVAITEKTKHNTIATLLLDESIDAQLCPESTERLLILRPILNQALLFIKRYTLSDWIYQTWQAMGFQLTLRCADSHNNIHRYFQCLTTHEESFSWTNFERSINQLFSDSVTPSENPVHIMTIHKSKGLEFDHVILLNINRGKGKSDTPLLQWATPLFSDGSSGLLLAAQPGKRDDCGIFEYLRFAEKQQSSEELSRLFYVACTRAKSTLSMSCIYNTEKKASAGSFLDKLPEVLYPKMSDDNAVAERDSTDDNNTTHNRHRLNQSSFLACSRPPTHGLISGNDTVALSLSITEQIIGTVTHAYLEALSLTNSTLWSSQTLKTQLIQAGLPLRKTKAASIEIQHNINKVLADPDGQFILSANHPDAKSEWCISEPTKRGIRRHIIDRYIIDDEGTHWIIDYKTSQPTGSSVESFLNAEAEKYYDQLMRYKRCLEKANRKIQCALYFTSLPRLHLVTLKIEHTNHAKALSE